MKKDTTRQKQANIDNNKNEEKLRDALIKARKKEKEIEELLTATSAILKTNNFEVAAKTIFDACARSIGAKAGYVALISDDGEENELLFLEDGGMPCTVNPELPMPIRGLRAESYKSGKVVYDNNFMNSEWVKFMPEGHMDLPNVLFSPLNIEGKTVGIMGMACKEGDFNENDARIAAAFGEYAAIALQNSRTFDMLEKRTKELHDTNIMKDKLFSIIAHDLRSPFNSILGFSDIMVEKSAKNDFSDMLKISTHLNNATKHSIELLNNLLEWSRAITGRLEFEPTEFAFGDTVKSVMKLLSSFAESKQIEVSTKDIDSTVLADFNMIQTIMRNLITNAIKYSKPGGKIVISGQDKGNYFIISVADNGIGMNKELLSKLFVLGEDVSMPGTNNERGTGLGLILCKEFVQKHSGKIWAKSEEGKGTTFAFTIPQKT